MFHYPDFDTFSRLARDYQLVPVCRRLVSDALTPVSAFYKIDRSDAEVTGRTLLTAYRGRDVIALAGLTTQHNREIMAEMAAQGEKHPRYESIFGGWRWQAVQDWDGETVEVRYRHYVGSAIDQYEANVNFGRLTQDELLTVVLIWEDGKWCFEDVNTPAADDFYAGAVEFKLIPEAY